MAVIVETKDLCKTYGTGDAEVKALKNCNIKISQGEIISILGASGSGKSTLLHLLGALDTPTSGEIIFNGKSMKNKSDKELSIFRRRNIGFVFQNYNLVPELTAEENIKLPLMLDGKSPDKKYMHQIVEMLGIEDRLLHLPGQLSGGQQQRVAIARAVINKPSVVFCDEPTGNLDSKSGAEVMKLLLYLTAELNITQVIVTHDINISKQTDRAITITDGTVEGGM
ncbi:MAG TPA: ABC transporter ATP-binding protein [Clostridiales bacterium]|nr:ABC transporter ATP-binding protein [Clostridiales bacterium]